jgi:hypothetical protein
MVVKAGQSRLRAPTDSLLGDQHSVRLDRTHFILQGPVLTMKYISEDLHIQFR